MPWAPDYLTLAEGKAWLRITDTVDDAELPVWITSASRAIDKAANRQFGQLAAPAARTYRRPPVYDPVSGLWLLEIDDLMVTTGFLVNGLSLAASGAVLLPDDNPSYGKPYERLGFSYAPTPTWPGAGPANVITGQWGWSTVPAGVTGACRLQLSRWNARRDAPLGVAGSPDQGSEVRLLARLDPDVVTSLTPYMRRRRVG